MKNRVVPFKQPHILVQGDAKMTKEPIVLTKEADDFLHEWVVAILKRAVANGTYKPILKASGE